jgi:hypothetical protein
MAPRKKQDAVTRILQTKHAIDMSMGLAPKSIARMQALNSAARPKIAQIQNEARVFDKFEKLASMKGRDARAVKEDMKSLIGFRPIPAVPCRQCGAKIALRVRFCPKCGAKTRFDIALR